jgi:hypothetical protein
MIQIALIVPSASPSNISVADLPGCGWIAPGSTAGFYPPSRFDLGAVVWVRH